MAVRVRSGSLALILAFAAAVASAQTTVTVTVDPRAGGHPIDARIYGVAFATAVQLGDLNVPTNRYGGNGTSRYNWQDNATNHAFDWYFESIGEESALAGAIADNFIASTKNAGAEPIITVPMMGWVARLGSNRAKLASFSVAKYGLQQDTDPFMPDAGNGVRPNGTEVTGNDPNDANKPVDAQFQAAWLRHLTTRWGAAQTGGVRLYALDNEPSIWFATHRDVHPEGARMDEVLDKMVDHARMIKASDTGALVMGPEEWGWAGYLYSGYDQQWAPLHDYASFPDRDSHGGRDYVPYLLAGMHARAGATRLLDILTVHYYPQGGEFSDDTSTSMQLRRNRSTRSLWDSNYKDESWIDDEVMLVPRLRGWVNAVDPTVLTGITEYNWGAENHINGATAQADILGIFGREGLDIANRWTTPPTGSPAYNAIRMYRNYDGQRSTFGDVSMNVTVPEADSLSAFAATRNADGARTVMLVHKAFDGPRTVVVKGIAGRAQVWQLTAANTITRLPDTANLTITVPPQSITLLVIPNSGVSRRRAVKH